MGIDVDLPDIFAVFDDRNHNFSFRIDGTAQIVVLFMNIGNHKSLVGNRNLTTDSFTERNYRVIGFSANIRSENQFFFVAVFKVKSSPVEIGYFLIQKLTNFLKFILSILCWTF